MRYRLHWTRATIEHILRHALTPADVEEALQGRLHTRRSGDQFLILAKSSRGVLFIVLSPSGETHDVAHVVTARKASRSEKRLLAHRGKR